MVEIFKLDTTGSCLRIIFLTWNTYKLNTVLFFGKILFLLTHDCVGNIFYYAFQLVLGKKEKKKGQAKFKEGYEEAAGISTPSKEVVEDSVPGSVTSEVNQLIALAHQPPLSAYITLAGDKNLQLVSSYKHIMKIHCRISKYRVSQEECEILRESVPYVKLYRYNPKYLYPKLNGYGVNGHRKVWASVVSTNCMPSMTPYSSTAQARQQETTKCSDVGEITLSCCLHQLLGNLRQMRQ